MLLVCFMAQTHFNGWLSVFAYPTNPVGGKEKKKKHRRNIINRRPKPKFVLQGLPTTAKENITLKEYQ